MSGAEVPDHQPKSSPRFLKIEDVALELATSNSQIYAVLRTGELQGIQIGGRKQWRIERSKLEEWIQARYRATQQGLAALPESLEDADQE
ncbi:MAG TPA: helix-turn-helix domain-containing protein [Microlunatus sp.]|nr:helix-turn-helix domain-containing protein [Microlunatus sp.]